jgi:hypothetical protein
MIKTIKPNTLPYPGCKIYPDYDFKSNNIAGTILSQLISYIPISRDGDLYLISKRYKLPNENEPITIYKYEKK